MYPHPGEDISHAPTTITGEHINQDQKMAFKT